jgi:glutathione S-transferase
MTQPGAEHLYFSTTSPYARKARIAAVEKNVPFEAVLDVPWNDDTKILAFNPLGKVPVWIMADGTALFDSRVIVEYIDTANSTSPLVPTDRIGRLAVKRLEALADGIMDASLVIFAERRKRPAELQYPDWVHRHFGKIHRGLRMLSDELGERAYFHGDRISLAEIGVASALGYIGLRFAEDFSWQADYPRLAALYERLMLRPSFSDTVPVL